MSEAMIGGATPNTVTVVGVLDGSGAVQALGEDGITLTVEEAPLAGDNRNVVTTAGTRVALATTTPCQWVAATAETDNTGVIVVGGSTVVASLATRRGIPLNAGETLTIPADNLANVYIDSTVNGDGVTFIYG